MPARPRLSHTRFWPYRLEADPQLVPRGFGETVERAGRGSAAAAFEASDSTLRRLHAPREFGLAQPGADARLGDRLDQRELLLQRIVFLAHLRVLQQDAFRSLNFVI